MDHRSTRLPPPNTAPCVTVIDGSAGLRITIAGLVKTHFPNATVEDIDPFSQTMRGAGLAIGSTGSAIVLGGVGTEAEANDALNRLRSRSNCPPIVMLVAESLLNLRATLIERGAFEVLRKDALSGQRLRRALAGAFLSRAALAQPDSTAAAQDGYLDAAQTALQATPQAAPQTAPQAAPQEATLIAAPPAAYGKFMFTADGDRMGIDIDGYRPVASISDGAMSQVYLAESIDADGQAAVKILTSVSMRNIAELAQIIAVAKRLRPLRGTAVVRELDSGVSANFLYVVLEFLKKGDLRRRRKMPMDENAGLRIILALLEALDALHGVGVCHADLKPESIFFRTDGSITLIDFNISTLFGQAVRASAVGDTLGTPIYMSPEQGAGKPVDGRSDLYAAGIILFELLTGAPPYVGDTAAQTIFRHLHDEVPLLPMKMRHLQPVVDQLLAKVADDRFHTAREVIAALTANAPSGDSAGGDVAGSASDSAGGDAAGSASDSDLT